MSAAHAVAGAIRARTITGPIRIDALAGNAPRWRADADESPIYDALIAELGPPGLLVGPAPTVPAEVTTC